MKQPERKRSSSSFQRSLESIVRTQGAGLEIQSRYYLYSAFAADLAAADDLAHAGDANRLPRPYFLPAETRWARRKTFLYLEVPNDEAER